MREIMLENYCDECGNEVHTILDKDDFWNHKIGLIRCNECGHIIKPCNECSGEKDFSVCANCPWTNAKIVDCPTDEEYLAWVKKNAPSIYEAYKKEENGFDYYRMLIIKMEMKEDMERAKKELEKEGYSNE